MINLIAWKSLYNIIGTLNKINHIFEGTRKMKEKITPKCQYCGAPMKKTNAVERSFLTAMFWGLSMIIFGIILCFTVAGAIFGIPLIFIGLFYGSKKKKVLKCTGCGALVDRR